MNDWNVSRTVDVPPRETRCVDVRVAMDCRCVRFLVEHRTIPVDPAAGDGAYAELMVDAEPVTLAATPLYFFHADSPEPLGVPRRLRRGHLVRLSVEAGTTHLSLRLRLVVLPDIGPPQ